MTDLDRNVDDDSYDENVRLDLGALAILKKFSLCLMNKPGFH